MQPADKSPRFIEVYQARSTMAAEKILDVLLLPEGIEATIHDRRPIMFPGVGEPGVYFVAVHADQADRAREILDEAQRNGFLDPEDGDLVNLRSRP
ncbi:MAG TPA: DUF2007 domain-containing protein [Haliangiales bacterium]|nr:DUF2007 domain-containing protein [Haliangiales bacterium]